MEPFGYGKLFYGYIVLNRKPHTEWDLGLIDKWVNSLKKFAHLSLKRSMFLRNRLVLSERPEMLSEFIIQLESGFSAETSDEAEYL